MFKKRNTSDSSIKKFFKSNSTTILSTTILVVISNILMLTFLYYDPNMAFNIYTTTRSFSNLINTSSFIHPDTQLTLLQLENIKNFSRTEMFTDLQTAADLSNASSTPLKVDIQDPTKDVSFLQQNKAKFIIILSIAIIIYLTSVVYGSDSDISGNLIKEPILYKIIDPGSTNVISSDILSVDLPTGPLHFHDVQEMTKSAEGQTTEGIPKNEEINAVIQESLKIVVEGAGNIKTEDELKQFYDTISSKYV